MKAELFHMKCRKYMKQNCPVKIIEMMNLSKNTGNSENNATAEGKRRVIFKQKILNNHSYNNQLSLEPHVDICNFEIK